MIPTVVPPGTISENLIKWWWFNKCYGNLYDYGGINAKEEAIHTSLVTFCTSSWCQERFLEKRFDVKVGYITRHDIT